MFIDLKKCDFNQKTMLVKLILFVFQTLFGFIACQAMH